MIHPSNRLLLCVALGSMLALVLWLILPTGDGDRPLAPGELEPSDAPETREQAHPAIPERSPPEGEVDRLELTLRDGESGALLTEGYAIGLFGEQRLETLGAVTRFEPESARGWVLAGAPGYGPARRHVDLGQVDQLELELFRPVRLEVRTVHQGRPVAASGRMLLCRSTDVEVLADLQRRAFQAQGSTLAPQLPLGPEHRRPAELERARLDRAALRAFVDQDHTRWDEYWSGDGRRAARFVAGTGHFPPVLVGQHSLLLWPTAGFSDGAIRRLELRPGADRVEVELAPARLLQGRIHHRGRPVAGAAVHFWGLAVDESEMPLDPCCGRTTRNDVDDVSVLSGPDGRFEARLNRQRVRVLVLWEPRPDEGLGEGLGFAHYEVVELRPDALRPLDIELHDRLDHEGSTDHLSTRVTDARGRPLHRAEVSIGVFGPQGHTDPDGRVRLHGLQGLAGHHRSSLSPERRRRRVEYLNVDWQDPQGRHHSITHRLTHEDLDRHGGRWPPIVLDLSTTD